MIIVIVIHLLLIFQVVIATQGDRFTRLPLVNEDMPTASFSGFLNITKTKAIHYILVESMSDPSTDPLVVWFNGGPGCSSMLGLMQEHGPFIIEDGEKEIKKNPHPWNQNASILYLESPAGVGFSTVSSKNELKYNDELVGKDSLKAMKMFYDKHPRFDSVNQNNSLYITGESYGGIYVPYLSFNIYMHN